MHTYYCVMSTFDDRGVCKGWLSGTAECETRPESEVKETRTKDIWTDWFDTREEALEYIRGLAFA